MYRFALILDAIRFTDTNAVGVADFVPGGPGSKICVSPAAHPALVQAGITLLAWRRSKVQY